MAIFAIQYVPSREATLDDARSRLRAACERLPISLVLLSTSLPAVAHACREEADCAGARLLRWHAPLTGGSAPKPWRPRPEWRPVGPTGNPVPLAGTSAGRPIACPNRPAVREIVLDRVRAMLQRGVYHGVFLDYIRYPSPASNPTSLLACFCDDCHRAASAEGFDLEAARRRVGRLAARPDLASALVRVLLDPLAPASSDLDLAAVREFLDFRAHSVTWFVQSIADLVHAKGLEVGLDCFSPALTRMVGQDLGALDSCSEWIKIMSYGHTLGTAGMPFTLLDLADWIIHEQSVSEAKALEWLSVAAHLPLPPTRVALRKRGLTPEALFAETRRARACGVSTLLAGIELNEVQGVTCLNQAQIAADLRAFRAAGPDGLALSWNLGQIPVERLDLVREIWVQAENGEQGTT